MICKIIKINSQKLEKKLIEKAGKIIRKGDLVAFPTETVYGLGANALDGKAIKKIFRAKGRPLDNPLIIHIADKRELYKLVKEVSKEAKRLIAKFWPGPLTLVFFKKKVIPSEVTVGSNTVAIRMPKNKIALELIKKAGVSIAAPSANLSGRPSPTTAQHVFEDLGDKVDLILDGGSTKIGVESTVLDLTVEPFQILRPGGISFEQLKKTIKDVQLHPSLLGKKFKGGVKSPGMKYRHYAPKASLILVDEAEASSPPFADARVVDEAKASSSRCAMFHSACAIRGSLRERVKKFQNLISFYKKQKKKVGLMLSQETKSFFKKDIVLVVGRRKNLKEISFNLFDTLREFDKMKVDIILAETFSEKGIGLAIMDRLKKAAY